MLDDIEYSHEQNSQDETHNGHEIEYELEYVYEVRYEYVEYVYELEYEIELENDGIMEARVEQEE